jgi:hypothetical protein
VHDHRGDQGSDAQDQGDVEDVRPDQVGDGQVGMAAGRGQPGDDELRGAGADTDHDDADDHGWDAGPGSDPAGTEHQLVSGEGEQEQPEDGGEQKQPHRDPFAGFWPVTRVGHRSRGASRRTNFEDHDTSRYPGHARIHDAGVPTTSAKLSTWSRSTLVASISHRGSTTGS